MKREKVLKIGRRSNQKLLPALLVLICCFSYASLAAKAKMKVGSNMRVSENLQNGTRKLTESQKIAIENDLNEKAGLNSIRFDTNGELTYDKTEEPVNGSAKFRQAITGAIDDETNEFILVNYSGSKNVIFALMDTGTSAVTLTSAAGKFLEAKRITIYQIRIDFDDYENSEKYTPEEVLRSHTIGITLFHEINHKVSYDENDPMPSRGVRHDKSSKGRRGVIENTNMVRKQLSLMLRKSNRHGGKKYKGSFYLYAQCYQLPFVSVSGKRKYLRWKLENNRERKG